MRWIRKGPEPESFRAWKASGTEDWSPTWEDLRDHEKEQFRACLVAEQADLCCYCCCRIENDRRSCHIEHLKPRHRPQYRHLQLDYQNLLASCGSPLQPTPDRHCGASKGGWYEPDLLVSPLDPDCEQRFAFTAAGEIRPAMPGDHAAKTTIRQLSLQCRSLVARRRAAIDGWLAGVEELGSSDLRRLLVAASTPDVAGRLTEFQPAIVHVLRNLL